MSGSAHIFPVSNEAKKAETLYSRWIWLGNKLKDMPRDSNASAWVKQEYAGFQGKETFNKRQMTHFHTE